MDRIAGQVGPVEIGLGEIHDLRIDAIRWNYIRDPLVLKLGADILAGVVGIGRRGRRVVDVLTDKGLREVALEFRGGRDVVPGLGSLRVTEALVPEVCGGNLIMSSLLWENG